MNPEESIKWVLSQKEKTVVTTSFGRYSAVLLHMVSEIDSNMTILWINTQFSTNETIKYKNDISKKLNLNVLEYVGKKWNQKIPDVDSDEYEKFTDQVKLEPFRRAVTEIGFKFWITGIRREQTEYRKQASQIDHQNDGIIKVAPLLEWTASQMDDYLITYDLPSEGNYYDPTKPNSDCECGLHTMTQENTK